MGFRRVERKPHENFKSVFFPDPDGWETKVVESGYLETRTGCPTKEELTSLILVLCLIFFVLKGQGSNSAQGFLWDTLYIEIFFICSFSPSVSWLWCFSSGRKPGGNFRVGWRKRERPSVEKTKSRDLDASEVEEGGGGGEWGGGGGGGGRIWYHHHPLLLLPLPHSAFHQEEGKDRGLRAAKNTACFKKNLTRWISLVSISFLHEIERLKRLEEQETQKMSF